MKGPEAAYLWAKAKILDDKSRAVAARGEVFHPSDNFIEIEDTPVKAQAIFQRNPDKLILRLRYEPSIDVTETQLDLIAAKFYGGRRFTAFPRVVLSDNTYVERAYVCEDLPENMTTTGIST